MKRWIRKTLMTLTLLFVMSVPLQASEVDDNTEAFLSVFELEAIDLDFHLEAFDPEMDGGYHDHGAEVDLSYIGRLKVTRGLDYQQFATFTCERSIAGNGVEGALVGALVYEKREKGIVSAHISMSTLGASGLYSETIDFAENTCQYLMMAVRTGGHTSYRVYEVTTKEAATKEFLENLEVRFMNEKEDDVVTVPKVLLPATTKIEF